MANVSVSVLSSTSMAVTWGPPEIAGMFVETYIITTIATCPDIPPRTSFLPSHQTHFELDDLEEGMTYHVLISARNAIGDSMLVGVKENTESEG